MRNFIKQYPLWSFLIINYIISWAFLYPSYQMILENDGEITPMALIGLIGAYGPTIAAIIVQSVVAKDQLRALLRKLIQVKAKWSLYLLLIFGPILFYGAAYIISTLFFEADLSLDVVKGLSGIPIWFLAALPFGPMGEELGWRGFLLPRLLEKHSAFKSSILVGLAWGVWHLASFTFPGAAIPEFIPVSVGSIGLYLLNTIALSLLFTYGHLKSKGSVFVAIILHAFFNAASNIIFDFFPEPENAALQTAAYVANILLVGLIGFFLLRKHERSQ